MNKKLIFFERTDIDKAIDKKFKKYTLEVDDAIEAHGFKAASYIDFAEDNIGRLQDVTKNHFRKHGNSLLFTNLLTTSLEETAQSIVNHTFENTVMRDEYYNEEKLKEKTYNLHEDLKFLNERLLKEFEIL